MTGDPADSAVHDLSGVQLNYLFFNHCAQAIRSGLKSQTRRHRPMALVSRQAVSC
jgi:hypothetical protein